MCNVCDVSSYVQTDGEGAFCVAGRCFSTARARTTETRLISNNSSPSSEAISHRCCVFLIWPRRLVAVVAVVVVILVDYCLKPPHLPGTGVHLMAIFVAVVYTERAVAREQWSSLKRQQCAPLAGQTSVECSVLRQRRLDAFCCCCCEAVAEVRK